MGKVHVLRHQPLQGRPPRDLLRAVRAVRLRRGGRPGALRRLGPDEAKAVLEETYRFAKDVLGPLNAVGDREGCRLENGRRHHAQGLQGRVEEALRAGLEDGRREPGVRRPGRARRCCRCSSRRCSRGANTAFNMYPGLAYGAAEVIAEFGTPEQQKHVRGAACSTASGAARCASPSRTPARRRRGEDDARASNADGTYNIRGTKIFISGGDHDLAENIIHLVLARVDGAPPGTKGLSLFIVPKLRVNADGTLGRAQRRHRRRPSSTRWASTARRPACSTSARTTTASASWSARVENVGMTQMFKMMNGARIARRHAGRWRWPSAAYLNALEYAKDRKQGAHVKQWKDPTAPRVADHRAPRRAPHAARHEGARRGHPRAGRQARACTTDQAHAARGQGRREGRLPPGPGRAARAAGEGVRLATRRSASARPRSRSTAAPATSRTTRSSSTAATRRSSPSTRAPTTSRRWTSSAASWARPAARTSSRSWRHRRLRRGAPRAPGARRRGRSSSAAAQEARDGRARWRCSAGRRTRQDGAGAARRPTASSR